MSKERTTYQNTNIDGITFTVNTIIVELKANYQYSLSSAMIPLELGNGLFIRQLKPDYIINGENIEADCPNKFSWQYTGSGLRNLKTGFAPSIEACYFAFKNASRRLIAA